MKTKGYVLTLAFILFLSIAVSLLSVYQQQGTIFAQDDSISTLFTTGSLIHDSISSSTFETIGGANRTIVVDDDTFYYTILGNFSAASFIAIDSMFGDISNPLDNTPFNLSFNGLSANYVDFRVSENDTLMRIGPNTFVYEFNYPSNITLIEVNLTSNLTQITEDESWFPISGFPAPPDSAYVIFRVNVFNATGGFQGIREQILKYSDANNANPVEYSTGSSIIYVYNVFDTATQKGMMNITAENAEFAVQNVSLRYQDSDTVTIAYDFDFTLDSPELTFGELYLFG